MKEPALEQIKGRKGWYCRFYSWEGPRKRVSLKTHDEDLAKYRRNEIERLLALKAR